MANPKKKVITTEQLRKIELAKERERRKEQGFFDGRFAPRVIPNKKKQKEKNRNWKKDIE